jgi:tetratricopeptide (TPR) repeat protein
MYDQAEALCRAEIEQRPGGGGIYALLADIEFLRGDIKGAQEALDTALALSPRDFTVLYKSFLHQARRGDFGAARESGVALAANLSEQAMDTAVLGYVYDRLGDHERAVALYRAKRRSEGLLLQRGTEDWYTYREMARLEILDGDRAEALRLLEGAYDHGMRDLILIRLDPVLALMEGEPEYDRLIARIESDVARMRDRVRAAERKPQS